VSFEFSSRSIQVLAVDADFAIMPDPLDVYELVQLYSPDEGAEMGQQASFHVAKHFPLCRAGRHLFPSSSTHVDHALQTYAD
jgi:hypothetical protein